VRFTLQGLLPSRRRELAEVVGETIERELLTVEDLTARIKNPDVQEKLREHIVVTTALRLEERMPSYLPRTLTEPAVEYITSLLEREIDGVLDESVDTLVNTLYVRMELAQLVEERLNSLDIEELEQLVTELAARELRHIRVVGGVLGFIIGVVQVLVLEVAA
jgi:uncharacterized membrane protein YheB (UPF0754 family)